MRRGNHVFLKDFYEELFWGDCIISKSSCGFRGKIGVKLKGLAHCAMD
jgi:hypothetical protein